MKRLQQFSGTQGDIYFVTWARAISVFLILLCHLTQTHENGYVVMSSQIFNVGVYIFLVISGFLFGHRGVSRPYGWWLWRRLKRIFIPYWAFIAMLLIILSMGNIPVDQTTLIRSVLGIQGFTYVLPGAQHTWFISAILLCYALTPVADVLITWAEKDPGSRRWAVVIGLFAIAMVGIVFLEQAPFLTTCPCYLIAYVVGRRWSPNCSSRKVGMLGVGCVVAAFAARFAIRFFVDGTIFYNHVIALYTHFLAAMGFFAAASCFFNKKPWRIVQLINDLSFEIYLVHYAFIWSPISVMNMTGSWTFNSLVVIILSIAAAWLLHLAINVMERTVISRKMRG